MQFLKVGLLFAASTLSRLLAGLIVVKIIAVYIGADGLGKLGQFMSVVTIITTLAGGGISTGIIKYVAEHKENRQELSGYIHAASFVTIIASLLVGAVLLFGADYISLALMQSAELASVIRALAAVQFVIAASNLLMGLVNGHKRVKAFALINVLSVAIGAAGMAFACAAYGIKGAMYGLMWMSSCSLLFLVPWYRHGLGFEWKQLLPEWHPEKTRRFMAYGLMVLVTAATMQSSQIVIRQIIEAKSGWHEVGYWQAVIKVSDAYLQFITVVLANYYLPRLAEQKDKAGIDRIVRGAYKVAIPTLLLLSSSVYVLREFVIPIIFSKAFLPAKDYFAGQLIGDFFKVGAYIVGYVSVARASTQLYIAAEIFQASMLVILTHFFVDHFGAVGATYAYSATYVVYFAVCYAIYRIYIIGSRSGNLLETS
jgi:O-antigen/teichoic acid export membrane protein